MDRTYLRNRLLKAARTTARRISADLDGLEECVNCGHNGPVEVHHRDGDALNNHPMNLVPLCHDCHQLAHGTRRMMDRLATMRSEAAALGD